MAKDSTTRAQEFRKSQLTRGMSQHQIWCRPDCWSAIKEFVAQQNATPVPVDKSHSVEETKRKPSKPPVPSWFLTDQDWAHYCNPRYYAAVKHPFDERPCPSIDDAAARAQMFGNITDPYSLYMERLRIRQNMTHVISRGEVDGPLPDLTMPSAAAAKWPGEESAPVPSSPVAPAAEAREHPERTWRAAGATEHEVPILIAEFMPDKSFDDDYNWGRAVDLIAKTRASLAEEAADPVQPAPAKPTVEFNDAPTF